MPPTKTMENQSQTPFYSPFDTPPESSKGCLGTPSSFDTPSSFRTPPQSPPDPFETPFDTPRESPLKASFESARECFSLVLVSPVKISGAILDLDSSPLVGAEEMDNPFVTPPPRHAGTTNAGGNPTIPSQQEPSQEGLDDIDELQCEDGRRRPQTAPPPKRRRYRRLPEELHDHARVSLTTAEDYFRYASRQRIPFDGTAGHPSSPTLGAVDAGGAKAKSGAAWTVDTVSHRAAEGKPEA